MAFDYNSQYPLPDNVCGQFVLDPATIQELDKIYEQILYRDSLLIQATGEDMGLFRRKLHGELCVCVDKVRQQASPECNICYGTMWKGGYDYIDTIKVRFIPAPNMRVLTELGLTIQHVPRAWTMKDPIVRTRDFLVARLQPSEINHYTVYNQAVVRGNILGEADADLLPKRHTTQIWKISDNQLQENVYTEHQDFNLQAFNVPGEFIQGTDWQLTIEGKIKWVDGGRRPATGAIYYVSFSYILTYTKRYQLQAVTTTSMQGKPLHQEFEIQLLDADNPIYKVASDFDVPVLKAGE